MLAIVLCLLAGCDGTGDRVLVAKHLYDVNMPPRRFDVVVFKYPLGPVDHGSPKNYIKRLLGLPGEIIAIFFGQLYRWFPEPGQRVPFDDSKVDANNLWRRDPNKVPHSLRANRDIPEGQVGMHEDTDFAKRLFESGEFVIDG